MEISKLLWEHVLCSPLISLDVSEITQIFDTVISSSSVHVACLFEILISQVGMKSLKEGMMEFEGIGLRHLKETLIRSLSLEFQSVFESTSDDVPTNKRKRGDYEDFNLRFLKDIKSGNEYKRRERRADDEESEITINENFSSFDEVDQPSNSEWRL
ncbi:1093_t:CDS:2 [Funneliformis caledonium]|uniref:1093_t:CDS:1 n=1 Tax=Funneliformis caledonium TaxID=1117310 RepID=A0A9N9C0V1_9GLOM|nr:1093_t:CDS:2 [Funneliformis caledonium]